ncbi:MAG: hypothetical protein V4650_03815 [Pseudomonadota bacterium]
MQLPWFNLTEVTAHAHALVEDLHRVRAGGVARGDKVGQIAKRLEKLLDDSAAFELKHKLNTYKKAKLLTLVREGLTAREWAAADIDPVISRLLTNRLRAPTR